MEGKEVGLLQRSFMNSRRCLGAGLRTLESTGISTFFGGADDPRMLAEDTSFRSTCGHHFALRNLLFFGGGAGFGNASYWAKRDMAEMVSADPKRQVINGRVQSTSLQQLMYVPNYWGWCQVSANIEVNSQ